MFIFNQKLRERIKDLERAAYYVEKERDLAEKKIWYQKEHEQSVNLEIYRKDIARYEATVIQLEARLAEAPYAQLTDILKALVVKLPTLNIQGITVTPKEK
jgi:hypothetical protein